MKWPEAGEAPARLANRMLGEQAWAREKLAPFAGRAFSLAVGPAVAAWSIRADGTLEAVPTGVDADLKLSLSPLSIPTFLADPARWNEFVTEDGDAELGGALKGLAGTLPWFVEEAFARALGPVAGQRVADAGRIGAYRDDDRHPHDIRIVAEINHAPRRTREEVRVLARQLAADGADVALCDVKAEWLADTAAAVESKGRRVKCVAADVANAYVRGKRHCLIAVAAGAAATQH